MSKREVICRASATPGQVLLRCLLPAAVFAALMALFFATYEPYRTIGDNLVPWQQVREGIPPQQDANWRGNWAMVHPEPDSGPRGGPCLRLDPGEGHGGMVEYVLREPRRFRHFSVTGWMRIEDVTEGRRPWNVARILLFFRDADGKPHWNHPHNVCSVEGTRSWFVCRNVIDVPDFAVTGHLYVQNAGASGTFWVDDVSVEPSEPRASYPVWRMAFAAGWAVTALYCVFFLRLWRRRIGLVVIANAVVIVIGLTTPGGVLQKAAEEQIVLVDSVRQALPEMGTPTNPPPPRAGEQAARPAPTSSARSQSKATTSKSPPAKPAPRVSPERLRKYMDWAKLRSHQVLFALLGFFSMLAMAEGIDRSAPRLERLKRLGLGLAGLLLFAGATEILQFVSLTRGPSWGDFFYDSGGIAVGATLGAGLAARRLISSRRGTGQRA